MIRKTTSSTVEVSTGLPRLIGLVIVLGMGIRFTKPSIRSST